MILNYIVQSCIANNNNQDAKNILAIIANNTAEVSILDRIAFMQSEIKDYDMCVGTLLKCLQHSIDEDTKYAIRSNLAKTLNHLNDPVSSLLYSQLNIDSQFDYDALMEMSFSHYLLGEYKQSENMMRQLAALEDLPQDIRDRVEYNISSYDIDRGNFKQGIQNFVDIGHKIGIWSYKSISTVPWWMGEGVSTKTILIHAEGGIGDELINVRFAKNLKALGANPIWITNNNDLRTVFTRNGIETVVDVAEVDISNAVQCLAMRLPILLNLDVDQLWDGPYLKPDETYITKWKSILPEGKKLAVKWAGNPYYEQDLHRSIPVEYIKKIPYNGTKINLQLEQERYQADMFNAGEHINSIEDTLAILWLCDDIVTSCTSIIHMCGAIGKRAVVCPPIACYYVWLGADGVSNWYDKSIKVVRQTQHKDWEFVESVLLSES